MGGETVILLTGASGQLGWELARELVSIGRVVPTTRDGKHPGGARLDLSDLDAIRDCVRKVSPDVIVNAAAYTAVDKAEEEPDSAVAVNVEAPRALASSAAEHGALLVHYSTDYVFDGRGARSYRETDPASPINVYGRTKLEGEAAVRATLGRHLILRSSWIYAARGRNFLLAMVNRASRGEPLAVVDDQIGTPTSARSLAVFTTAILAQWRAHSNAWLERRSGTYHVTPQGCCSWYEFARAILQRSPYATSTLTQIPSRAYRTSAARPTFSVLDSSRAREAFGLAMGDWRAQLDDVMSELFPVDRGTG